MENCSTSCKFVISVHNAIQNRKYFGTSSDCIVATQNILIQQHKKTKDKEVKKLLDKSLKKCSSCHC